MAAKKKSKKTPAKKPAKKHVAPKRKLTKRKTARRKRLVLETTAFPAESKRQTDVQSGDLQGLSSVESADSESVDELLEEGNAFEAEIVKGVEDARDAGEGRVRTHEVPEDDVPSEYLDDQQ